tara:strand:+ start:220 stop:1377 length:1158 start_codon:yes stop_codon:yes gene_type:complete
MGKIKLKSSIINDKYTNYVYEAFDIQNKEETEVEVSFDLSEAKNFDWNIGVIYGSSGSGKTTILKRMGELSKSNFNGEKSLISNFDWLEPKDASHLLSSMGLSSVPTWLRPFHLLSNGEQFRAEVAYKVGKAKKNEVILIDEYTSVVDRDVAKAMSYALQKYVRKTNKRIILASCHYDIMEWLTPDWICSPQKNGGSLERGQWRRQSRPSIELQVSRVESSTWDIFKKHHYLTEAVNKSCKFLLFTWNEKPVGIVAMINQPRKGCPNGFAISRVVILPDFQGMGLGTKICEFSASLFVAQGGKVYIKTINPALGVYHNKSDKWRGTSMNGKIRKLKEDTDKKARNRLTRASYCHEYIGKGISGYEELLKPIKEMREAKSLMLFKY